MASLKTRIEAKLAIFHKRLGQYVAISKKGMTDNLNRQVLQLIVGGKGQRGLIHYTQKATEARIRSDLAREVTYRIKGRGRAFTSRLSRVLAAQALHDKGIKITRATLDAKEEKIIGQRVRHTRAYIAASWLFAAQKMSTVVPGNTLTRLNDSDIPRDSHKNAARAEALTSPATQQFLTAVVFNTAIGASKIAQKAIPKALAAGARSMAKYILRETSKLMGTKVKFIAGG